MSTLCATDLVTVFVVKSYVQKLSFAGNTPLRKIGTDSAAVVLRAIADPDFVASCETEAWIELYQFGCVTRMSIHHFPLYNHPVISVISEAINFEKVASWQLRDEKLATLTFWYERKRERGLKFLGFDPKWASA